MGDLFISYAREDAAFADNLVKEFKSKGWSVWWDRTIPPGKTWREVIGEALNKAKCIIVLWSEHSVKSDWVITEADYGKNLQILIPVFIEKVDPPLGFGNIQGADLIGWKYGKSHYGLSALISAIQELIELHDNTSESNHIQEGSNRKGIKGKRKRLNFLKNRVENISKNKKLDIGGSAAVISVGVAEAAKDYFKKKAEKQNPEISEAISKGTVEAAKTIIKRKEVDANKKDQLNKENNININRALVISLIAIILLIILAFIFKNN